MIGLGGAFLLITVLAIATTKKLKQWKAIDFSSKAIAVESGQPVYPEYTDITLTNNLDNEIEVFINEEMVTVQGLEKLNVENTKAGTYTLLAVSNDKGDPSITVGYTIK